MSLWLGSLGAGNAPGFFFSFCFAFFWRKRSNVFLQLLPVRRLAALKNELKKHFSEGAKRSEILGALTIACLVKSGSALDTCKKAFKIIKKESLNKEKV
jgi:hypothetical protein